MDGNIPSFSIEADSIPEVWEKGINIKTEYDKSGDPPSKDATVMITVKNPFKEPRIHKNIPGGPVELESYRLEVLNEIHDHWIDPEAGKWTYTYHKRLFAYNPAEDLNKSDSPRSFVPIDQIQYIIEKLAQSGHTRRAQAITWMPTADPQTNDPPCLQRLWARILKDEDNNELVLNLNSHWRSRDLYKAWFMNVYAITELQKIMAEQISKKIGRSVRVGRYMDISDSLHLPEIKKMKSEPIENRVWNSNHPAFSAMTLEAREKLAKNPDVYSKKDRQ